MIQNSTAYRSIAEKVACSVPVPRKRADPEAGVARSGAGFAQLAERWGVEGDGEGHGEVDTEVPPCSAALRRSQLLKQATVLSAGISSIYLCLHGASGRSSFVAINGLALLLYGFVLLVAHRGHFVWARGVVLCTATVQLSLLSLLALGPHAGAHFYLIASAGVGVLLFRAKERWQQMFYFGTALGLFGAIEYQLLPAFPLDPLPLHQAAAWHAVATMTTAAVLAWIVVSYQQLADRAETAQRRAHVRSEQLLGHVLPPLVATRLKRGEEVADRIPQASVLFADLTSFTPLAERVTPHTLVTLLHRIVSAFDGLCAEHAIEKIKTIGDAYMAAGGLGVGVGQGARLGSDHVVAMADLAVAMQRWMQTQLPQVARDVIGERPILAQAGGFDRIQLRIGLHVGPVVAGVIGQHKFGYDLWGDTVNTASRLESHGTPGAVHVSESFVLALQQSKDAQRFEIVARGPVKLKGKGAVRTYHLQQAKGELSHGSSVHPQCATSEEPPFFRAG